MKSINILCENKNNLHNISVKKTRN